jgi:hypothetical protein
MDFVRLRARIWVDACLAACRREGVPATVLAMGDSDAGTVLLKWRRPDGAGMVFAAYTSLEGDRVWRSATGAAEVSETECDAYWQRQRGRDPDLWVLEIESKAAWHPLQEPMDSADAAEPSAVDAAAALFRRRR